MEFFKHRTEMPIVLSDGNRTEKMYKTVLLPATPGTSVIKIYHTDLAGVGRRQ